MNRDRDIQVVIRSLHELADRPELWMAGPGIPPGSETVASASQWIKKLFNEEYDVEVFPAQNNAVLLSAIHGKYTLDLTISESHVMSMEIQQDVENGYDMISFIESPSLEQINSALKQYGPVSRRSRINSVCPSLSIGEKYKNICISASSHLDIIALKSRGIKSHAFQTIRDRYPSSICNAARKYRKQSAIISNASIPQYAGMRSQSDTWLYSRKTWNGADVISKKMYA